LFFDLEAGAGGDGATVGSSQLVQAASLKDAAQRAEDAAARAQLAASGTESAVLFGASSTLSSREEFLPQSIYTLLRYEDLVMINGDATILRMVLSLFGPLLKFSLALRHLPTFLLFLPANFV